MEVRTVIEITDEERQEYENEFAGLDLTEDNLDDEQQALQNEELKNLELELQEDGFLEFLDEVKTMEDHIQDEGHPIQVSSKVQ